MLGQARAVVGAQYGQGGGFQKRRRFQKPLHQPTFACENRHVINGGHPVVRQQRYPAWRKANAGHVSRAMLIAARSSQDFACCAR